MKIILRHYYWKGLKNTYNTPQEKCIYILDENEKTICEVHSDILDENFQADNRRIRDIHKPYLEALRKYLVDNKISYQIAETNERIWTRIKNGRKKTIKDVNVEIDV